MRAPVLIIGQGLAGTALGLELEAARIPFEIVEAPDVTAASRVAAGLVNPVTGQRFVKTWRVDELLPVARAAYARWEKRFGLRLWRDVEVERRFADATERERATRKFAAGELAPFAKRLSEHALELEGAAWVDLPALLDAAAAHWRCAGVWRAATVQANEFEFSAAVRSPGDAIVRWRGAAFRAVICCVGYGALVREWFAGLPFALVKGQILSLRADGLKPERLVHRGKWLLTDHLERARVGATFERDLADCTCTAEARAELLAAARELAGGRANFEVLGQAAGVRLALLDKLPLAGWHPRRPGLGCLGALGSKGTLWAPWLAQAWAAELAGQNALSRDVSATRFMTSATH